MKKPFVWIFTLLIKSSADFTNIDEAGEQCVRGIEQNENDYSTFKTYKCKGCFLTDTFENIFEELHNGMFYCQCCRPIEYEQIHEWIHLELIKIGLGISGTSIDTISVYSRLSHLNFNLSTFTDFILSYIENEDEYNENFYINLRDKITQSSLAEKEQMAEILENSILNCTKILSYRQLEQDLINKHYLRMPSRNSFFQLIFNLKGALKSPDILDGLQLVKLSVSTFSDFDSDVFIMRYFKILFGHCAQKCGVPMDFEIIYELLYKYEKNLDKFQLLHNAVQKKYGLLDYTQVMGLTKEYFTKSKSVYCAIPLINCLNASPAIKDDDIISLLRSLAKNEVSYKVFSTPSVAKTNAFIYLLESTSSRIRTKPETVFEIFAKLKAGDKAKADFISIFKTYLLAFDNEEITELWFSVLHQCSAYKLELLSQAIPFAFFTPDIIEASCKLQFKKKAFLKALIMSLIEKNSISKDNAFYFIKRFNNKKLCVAKDIISEYFVNV
ncbi:hypothetical protein ENBRE01_1126 [Enteropsectra breve]|nr:hypothetical protein ENBRE01_1126 [Enteropsectra breve]